ncbi:MAG: hypothetical protein PVI13_11665 [Desulfobacterales bacterium]|jgi:hypothetical protein
MDKQITITGMVKEIGANWKIPRVCIVSRDALYLVAVKGQGENLFHEIGNRVRATGTLSLTAEGFQKIAVDSYRVFRMEQAYGRYFEHVPQNYSASRLQNGDHY